MDLSTYLRSLKHKKPIRARVAEHAGVSVNYLYKVAGGHCNPSISLAIRIEDATRAYAHETGGAVVTAIELLGRAVRAARA